MESSTNQFLQFLDNISRFVFSVLLQCFHSVLSYVAQFGLCLLAHLCNRLCHLILRVLSRPIRSRMGWESVFSSNLQHSTHFGIGTRIISLSITGLRLRPASRMLLSTSDRNYSVIATIRWNCIPNLLSTYIGIMDCHKQCLRILDCHLC